MSDHSPSRRAALGSLALLPWVLPGCVTEGTTASAGGTVLAQAPTYRVGDRWSYRIDPQFRASPDYDETWEVTAVAPDSISVRVVAKGGPTDVTRIERWTAPGLVAEGSLMDIETRRFAEPMQRYRFPLASGERWNQWVEQVNVTQGTSGKINRYVSVGGVERIATPAGTFDAIRMTVVMRLDDETPFRHATEATQIVWWSAAVRGAVREQRRAQYREKGGGRDANPYLPSQADIVELVAFTPGR